MNMTLKERSLRPTDALKKHKTRSHPPHPPDQLSGTKVSLKLNKGSPHSWETGGMVEAHNKVD